MNVNNTSGSDDRSIDKRLKKKKEEEEEKENYNQ